MKLAQARAINQYSLPGKWLIVAAGNREKDEKDSSLITPLGTAFKARFEIVNYLPTTAGYVDFLRGSTTKFPKAFGATPSEFVLPELISYFESGVGEEFFHDLDTSIEGQEIHASPRSWMDSMQYVYSKIKVLAQKQQTIGTDELQRILSRMVGAPAASHFIAFYKLVKQYDVASLVKVFDEPDKAPLPRKSGGQYKADESHALFAAIISKSIEMGKLTPQQFSNIVDYSIRLDDAEYAASLTKGVISKHPYMKKDTAYMKHMTRFEAAYLT
jgi:hypothetical protein